MVQAARERERKKKEMYPMMTALTVMPRSLAVCFNLLNDVRGEMGKIY